MTVPAFAPRTRDQLAARIARDIPEGWYVNLGIGMPTLIADHVPDSREVVFHSENGLLGMGPAPAADAVDPWIINAGKQHVTLVAGASYFHHADSFAIVRGGHLDLCVMGALEVAENGDLANWATNPGAAPAVGGAMDLAAGARRIWIMMDHCAKDGSPKLVRHCRYPLTAPGVVTRVYTDLASFEVGEGGLRVTDMVDGLTLEDLRARTEARILG
jgi:3-oxoadipate CoA-transferase beta subunit